MSIHNYRIMNYRCIHNKKTAYTHLFYHSHSLFLISHSRLLYSSTLCFSSSHSRLSYHSHPHFISFALSHSYLSYSFRQHHSLPFPSTPFSLSPTAGALRVFPVGEASVRRLREEPGAVEALGRTGGHGTHLDRP